MINVRSVRINSIDALRAIAVLLTLFRHLPTENLPQDGPDFLFNLIYILQRGGWVGVDIFFVISGFLVSGLLFKDLSSKKVLSLKKFYIRRAIRIYPPFYFFIFITLIFYGLQGQFFPKEVVLVEILFIQSYLPGIWIHHWSLAVEEHFYIVLPWILRLTMSPKKGFFQRCSCSLIPCVLMFFSLFLFLRVVNFFLRNEYNNYSHIFASHLRLDSLFFGVLISYCYHFYNKEFELFCKKNKRYLIVIGLLLVSPAFMLELETDPILYTFGLTFNYIGSGLMLSGLIYSQLFSHPSLKWLSWIGKHSYSIYLWHLFVFWKIVPAITNFLQIASISFVVLLYLLVSILVGVLMSTLIEKPCMKLRYRYFD